MDTLDKEIEAIRAIQSQLIETALRLSGGDIFTASALLVSTGMRWSLLCQIDGLDLYDSCSEAIAHHWEWEKKNKR